MFNFNRKTTTVPSKESISVLIAVVDGGSSEWIMNFLSGKCELDSCPARTKESLEHTWSTDRELAAIMS